MPIFLFPDPEKRKKNVQKNQQLPVARFFTLRVSASSAEEKQELLDHRVLV
mgnify:CR=1 FL=1